MGFHIFGNSSHYGEDKKTLKKIIDRRKELERLLEINKGKRSNDFERVNFINFFEAYINKSSNFITENNKKNYKKSLNHWKKFAERKKYANLIIGNIDSNIIQEFAGYLLEKLSDNTAHTYLGKIKAIFNYLVDKKEAIDKSPAKIVNIKPILILKN